MSADANADANEAIVREAIDGFYRAFEQKSVELLRKVVTADWEYVPEPPGAVRGPDQMVRVFPSESGATGVTEERPTTRNSVGQGHGRGDRTQEVAGSSPASSIRWIVNEYGTRRSGWRCRRASWLGRGYQRVYELAARPRDHGRRKMS